MEIELKKIENALRKQKNRTADFEDIEYLILK